MKNIDTVINAIVEEGFTATVFFIPILMVVLDVVAGSGYYAAVVAEIVGKKGKVIAIERIPKLAERARRNLEYLGYDNVIIVVGDGTKGYPPANLVCLALPFVTYLMWRYYENLEGYVDLRRIVKSCVILSMFNVALDFIYALNGFSPNPDSLVLLLDRLDRSFNISEF
jgi:SAM-dependent methyltransferase